jgi:hypothetical protein
LRFNLSFKGGQFFIVDELRYRSGHHLLSFLSDFNITGAIDYLINNSAHTLFILFASIFELFRYLVIHLFIDDSIPAYELNNSTIGIGYSASLNSIFSSINIVLVYLIVRSFGGNKMQGILASALLSLSVVNFYFSRHLIPYDLSISLSLISFYFIGKSRNGYKYQFICGLFSGLSTLTYFGYWILALIALLSCILRNNNICYKAAFWCGIGGLTPLLILQFIGYLVGLNYIHNVWEFVLATQSNQMGDPYSGLKVYFDYMWKADNILFYFMLFFTLFSSLYIKASFNFILNHRSIGFFSTLFILIILFYLSQVEGSFVLYGRTAKMVVPFICVACSYPLFVFLKIKKKQSIIYLIIISFISLLIISIFNHLKVLNIVYPRNIKDEALQISNNFEEFSTLSGKNIRKLERHKASAPYSLINAQWLVPPLTISVKDIPKGKVLLKAQHPYSSFPPYLFLHYNNIERSIIQNNNLEMLFIKKYER